MAQSEQRSSESSYAKKKREEREGTREPFEFVSSESAQTGHPPQSDGRTQLTGQTTPVPEIPRVAAPPVRPKKYSSSGIFADGETWQRGKVIGFDETASPIAGHVEIKGNRYPFTCACAKVAQLNANNLRSGEIILVRLKLDGDTPVVKSLKPAVFRL